MWPNALRYLLSWVWPNSVERVEGRHGPLEVRWELGRKVLNSEHGNQSFGSLHRVWQGVLGKVLTLRPAPRTVLLLGLGGGSAHHILRRELGLAVHMTAVEIDPVMIALAADHFALHEGPDLRIIEGDATIAVHGMNERFDLILVDLFDDLDLARGVDTNGFAHALRDRCAEDGIVCFNTVAHDAASNLRCQRVRQHLSKAFLHVEEWTFEGANRVFVAE
ncbi:MAG: fused MFS/spermidine synthase [Flavobacteriales bacterium]|jgi:spermidine synthase|nr:fused MFS/spermidine synthase [Flavobacteriales bacterium]MBP7448977.1 fused MFS/spermidine synthase [Flavobacteriales bacterium]HOZ40136.1 fused MFS/spermidine synthase [Flavobacteriales bacterium]